MLQTKLVRPRVKNDLVIRPRLLERLDRALEVPLTLVSAGAGYGKTTLVSSWIETLAAGRLPGATPPPVAWISLDEGDSEIEVFLRYFIAALSSIFPGACTATSDLLLARQRPPQALLFATFSNDLAHLPRSFIVVLDDHQKIAGSAVPDLISELLQHWPQQMHMVLISRHDPALPLAALRARGQMIEIRTHDLRFTPAEVAEYLDRAPAALDESAVEQLERRTEGWIAGLQLAVLSLLASDDAGATLAGLLSSDVDFTGYLVEELLLRQPAPVLAFLYQTAILDHFSTTLCDHIVSTGDPAWSARRCIDWLERTNLFIVSLDGRKEWYRYHQVFRSVLLQRAVTELGSERIDALRVQATRWFAGQGLVEEALHYALAANDLTLAAELMEHGLRDVLNREDRATLERWRHLLPEELVQHRPGLLMGKAWSLQFSWQLGQQGKIVQQVARMLDEGAAAELPAEDSRTLRGQVAALLGQQAYFANNLDGALAYSQESLSLLPPSWQYARSGAMLFLALAMQAKGQGAAAEHLLVEAYESVEDKTGTYPLRLLLTLSFVYYAQAGDLDRVRQTAQRLVEASEQNRLGILKSWGHYLLGIVHYQRNGLELAAPHFAYVIENQYTAQAAVVRDSAVRLALVHATLGRQAEAWRLAEFLAGLDVAQAGHETAETASLRARLWLAAGDLERAARWADHFSAPVTDRPLLWEDSPHLVQARILVCKGTAASAQAALASLAPVERLARATHNMRLSMEVLATRAMALGVLHRSGEATATLRTAVNLARPGGWVRPFLELGLPMRDALTRLAMRHTGSRDTTDSPPIEAIQRLLVEFPVRPPDAEPGLETHSVAVARVASGPTNGGPRGTPEPLVEPLTPRELEILALMREPLSMKEIARTLTISYETARRHAANIYGKLAANRRWEAVAAAEELGILPPRPSR